MASADAKTLQFIDSHTGGEPTRVILDNGLNLGQGSVQQRLQTLRDQQDSLRTATLNEPRGSDILVGALLGEPQRNDSVASLIFFNNVGYLGMCGHGTIGAAVTLAHLGKIQPGKHQLDTVVGSVGFTLHDKHLVSVDNVPCYRYRKAVALDLPGQGQIHGDIAWGDNWFFLIADHNQALDANRTDHLTAYCTTVRQQLQVQGITGKDGAEIDHIELFAPPSNPALADSKNFVLCPGMVYDRSPCGTGTSAKMACLYADKKLSLNQTWRQESIIGSIFEGSLSSGDKGELLPSITGSAFITAEGTLHFDKADPFKAGIIKQGG